jgi:hypothetical protein
MDVPAALGSKAHRRELRDHEVGIATDRRHHQQKLGAIFAQP